MENDMRLRIVGAFVERVGVVLVDGIVKKKDKDISQECARRLRELLNMVLDVVKSDEDLAYHVPSLPRIEAVLLVLGEHQTLSSLASDVSHGRVSALTPDELRDMVKAIWAPSANRERVLSSLV